LREKLLKASLIHSKTYGFGDAMITAACKDFGLSSITGAVLKRGPIEVVDFAMQTWLNQMREDLKSKDLNGLNVSNRIHLGIKTRL